MRERACGENPTKEAEGSREKEVGAEDPTKKKREQGSQKRGRKEQRREPHRKRQRSRAKGVVMRKNPTKKLIGKMPD